MLMWETGNSLLLALRACLFYCMLRSGKLLQIQLNSNQHLSAREKGCVVLQSCFPVKINTQIYFSLNGCL